MDGSDEDASSSSEDKLKEEFKEEINEDDFEEDLEQQHFLEPQVSLGANIGEPRFFYYFFMSSI